MAEVRARALEAPVGDLHELVIRHELQHTETMLQAMALAGVTPPSFHGPDNVDGSGLEMIEVAEGPFELGADADGFAYDNERPRHTAPPAATRSAARRSRTRPGRRGPRRATRSASSGRTPAGRGAPSTAWTRTPAERPTHP